MEGLPPVMPAPAESRLPWAGVDTAANAITVALVFVTTDDAIAFSFVQYRRVMSHSWSTKRNPRAHFDLPREDPNMLRDPIVAKA